MQCAFIRDCIHFRMTKQIMNIAKAQEEVKQTECATRRYRKVYTKMQAREDAAIQNVSFTEASTVKYMYVEYYMH